MSQIKNQNCENERKLQGKKQCSPDKICNTVVVYRCVKPPKNKSVKKNKKQTLEKSKQLSKKKKDIKKTSEIKEKKSPVEEKKSPVEEKKSPVEEKKSSEKKSPVVKPNLNGIKNCDDKRIAYCKTKNKICNTHTNRCINPPKSKTVKKLRSKKIKKKITIADQSIKPDSIKKVDKTIPYSPTINKYLLSLKSVSPEIIKKSECDDDSVYINGKCWKWTSKRAKDAALKNLRSKKPISCETIIAPKQYDSNCWFNSFFITFFVSDLGRKFNKWLRETMVTGIKPDKKAISNNKLRKALFIFNLYIDASLRSEYDKEKFALLMNTNNIINDIHRAIGKETKRRFGSTVIEKRGKASNPITFYKGLYNYLGGNMMPWSDIDVDRAGKDVYDHITKEMISEVGLVPPSDKKTKLPRVLFLGFGDDASRKMFSNVINKRLKFEVEFDKKIYTYTLDSVILRNTKKHHFSSYITCNGKEYSFDGMSLKPMEPFNWREKLNRDVEWSLEPKKDGIYFNFTKGYQILIYYLTGVKNKK